MNRKISPIVYFIVAAVYFILLAWLMSCNTPKKIAKKKEQAYQTVLTDSAMFRSIGDKWRKINPCTNDTIIGETEVLILSDTQYIRNTDTLVEFMPDTVRITQTKTNTVTKYIVDNKAIKELQDSLHAAGLREAELNGRIIQLTKDKADQEKRAVLAEKRQRQLGWGIWSLVVLLLVTHGLRSLPNISKLLKN